MTRPDEHWRVVGEMKVDRADTGGLALSVLLVRWATQPVREERSAARPMVQGETSG